MEILFLMDFVIQLMNSKNYKIIMNIYGIGIDIVKISRLVKLFKKRPFKKNIFKKEIQKCSKKRLHFTHALQKFAAKEAFQKL